MKFQLLSKIYSGLIFFTFSLSTTLLAQTSQPPSVGGCYIFPADNVWNTRIDTLPVDPSSSTYISTEGNHGTPLHPDFGTLYNGVPNGWPFVIVPASQPKVPIVYTLYGSESDPGPYPIPTTAPVEGGSASEGDRHVFALQSGTCKLYELFYAFPQADGSWQAGSGSIFDLTSNALRPDGWGSTDAAGLPVFPALVRYDEVQQALAADGLLHHALRFTVVNSRASHVWPARHHASLSTNPAALPMGLRFRLKASTNIDVYPGTNTAVSPINKVILQTLKTYGMFVADNGGPGGGFFVSGTPDSRWDDGDLHALLHYTAGDFEAVDESSLMVDPNSAQALQSSTVAAAPTASPSSDDTMIPPASQIVDSKGVVWTVKSGASYENGNYDGGQNITLLLYYSGAIYAQITNGSWYSHASGTWQQVARDPRSVSLSVSNTMIPPASQIVDGKGVVWTVKSGESFENGNYDGGENITLLLYYNSAIYAQITNGSWYSHASGTWLQVAGDPRPASSSSPSSDTMIPPASQIVDSKGVVWTVKSGESYENGNYDGGQSITLLLYYNSTIYAQITNGSWYSHASGTWQLVAGDPRSGSSPSPSTYPTIPSLSQIVDSRGVVWTVKSGLSYENGIYDWGASITLLLYYNNTIYAQITNGSWYSHALGIWQLISGDPRSGSSSPSSYPTIPSLSQIVDSKGVVWTVNSGQSYENGNYDGGHSITLLLYYNSIIYAQVTDGSWYSHASGTWQWISADPRVN